MQETKVDVSKEIQTIVAPREEEKFKSSFDNAEYHRWSEKLRNRNRSKDK